VEKDIAAVLESSRANGPMREVPLGFVLTLANAVAEAAIDSIIREPACAEAHSAIAFDAIWRLVAGSPSPAKN